MVETLSNQNYDQLLEIDPADISFINNILTNNVGIDNIRDFERISCGCNIILDAGDSLILFVRHRKLDEVICFNGISGGAGVPDKYMNLLVNEYRGQTEIGKHKLPGLTDARMHSLPNPSEIVNVLAHFSKVVDFKRTMSTEILQELTDEVKIDGKEFEWVENKNILKEIYGLSTYENFPIDLAKFLIKVLDRDDFSTFDIYPGILRVSQRGTTPMKTFGFQKTALVDARDFLSSEYVGKLKNDSNILRIDDFQQFIAIPKGVIFKLAQEHRSKLLNLPRPRILEEEGRKLEVIVNGRNLQIQIASSVLDYVLAAA